MNKAAKYMVEQESLWYDEASFVYMPKSGTAGSWRRSIPIVTDFHSDCRSLCSYSNVCECLLLLILASTSCHLRCWYYLFWKMTMMKPQYSFDFQFPYNERCWTILCFSVTWVSAFENSLFKPVLIFIEFFCFLDISYWVLYWILAINQIWSW